MKILVLANFGMGLYNFRKELLEQLIQQGNEVYLSLPNDEYIPKLEKLGCHFIDTHLERRGTNPLKDLKLLVQYIKIVKQIKPDVVLTYTIKPNIYGGLACSLKNTPYLTTITGLGTSVENKGLIQKITLKLYKLALKKATRVFFQNQTNQKFFKEHRISNGETKLVPGSGVNLEKHKYEVYPNSDEDIRFLFIGRIMKAKGIEELMKAAEIVKCKYSNVEFDIIGGIEEDYNEKISELEKQGILKYYGQQDNVNEFIKNSNATILPSYHEGLANVLLESAASGRPVLASRVPGCIETFEEGKTGIGFEAKDVDSLVNAIEKFLSLTNEERKAMSIAGRKKMESEFDRNLVINAYLQEIYDDKKGNSYEPI
ncbi:glycosyltransferase family 4 protein [Sporosarcina sp. ZBG7A]|uniref:glycosyltransferase family 4 protein n=1 Tax=Sporosarcina sp. ZBG7A TaxID=1582223 RepID=UPI000A7739EE|nr:glycosyltransferase family 4 protein [Sporosarcina sp. ZBG7A]